MGEAVLDGAAAWGTLQTWLSAPRVILLDEPPELDKHPARWSGTLDLRGGHWTDAYLAAFAAAGHHRLVAFDRDLRRFRGLDWLHLAP